MTGRVCVCTPNNRANRGSNLNCNKINFGINNSIRLIGDDDQSYVNKNIPAKADNREGVV